jgi:hypothetical protein
MAGFKSPLPAEDGRKNLIVARRSAQLEGRLYTRRVPDDLQLFDDTPVSVAPNSSETEEDVDSELSAVHASVSSADWTIETIVSQMEKQRIDLNPRFQRRSAWTDPTKSKFIESAILSYPIPQLVLAEHPENRGHFLVIDGKQRLLALRQFYAGLQMDSDFDPLMLSGLTVLPELKGFTIADLKGKRSSLFDSFETHTIRTVVVRNWESEDFLYTLFLRLNTGSVPLSPQELRQALVPGPFVEWADVASGESLGLRTLLGNVGPDRRMVDAELLVRFLGLRLSRSSYRGNLKQFLDGVCSEFNGLWAQAEADITHELAEMEKAIVAAREIFGEVACHKWTGQKWERAFNKAIFDVQIGSLADQEVREQALDKADEVKEKFKDLCASNADFSKSVSTTTKSLQATRERFGTWFSAIAEVTGVPLATPACLDAQ